MMDAVSAPAIKMGLRNVSSVSTTGGDPVDGFAERNNGEEEEVVVVEPTTAANTAGATADAAGATSRFWVRSIRANCSGVSSWIKWQRRP